VLPIGRVGLRKEYAMTPEEESLKTSILAELQV
jgi:hypothetical protein